jgi:hypothetical protein
MSDNLSNTQRMALACSALGRFAAAPTPKLKTNVTGAVTEYQEAWIVNRRTAVIFETDDPDDMEPVPMLNDEEHAALALQAVGETLLNRDPELVSKMLEFVNAYREQRGW